MGNTQDRNRVLTSIGEQWLDPLVQEWQENLNFFKYKVAFSQRFLLQGIESWNENDTKTIGQEAYLIDALIYDCMKMCAMWNA